MIDNQVLCLEQKVDNSVSEIFGDICKSIERPSECNKEAITKRILKETLATFNRRLENQGSSTEE